METENKQIVEKKVYEEGKKNYATKGEALGIGIPALVLGGLATLSLWGRGNGLLGGNNTGMPENININSATGGNSGSGATAPTAFQTWSKECEDVLALTNELWGLKLNTEREMYAHRETDVKEKHELWRSQIDADFGLYKSQVEADFGLYKNQRDMYDALNEKYGAKFNELDKKVAVMEATRPYQDKLIQCEIKEALISAINYTDRKTCRMITGAVVLPDNQQLSGYPSYCCPAQQG